MKTQPLQIYTHYASVDGVNNLQISHVITRAPFQGMLNIIKTFTSRKHEAHTRAIRYVKRHTL